MVASRDGGYTILIFNIGMYVPQVLKNGGFGAITLKIVPQEFEILSIKP